MSVLSQFFGGAIKSIQRGSTTIISGFSATVTISSVNTAKSIVIATFRNGHGDSALNSDTNVSISASGVLTNSTTLTVFRGSGGVFNNPNPYPTLDWQIIEFI